MPWQAYRSSVAVGLKGFCPDMCECACAEEKMHELRTKFHKHHPAKAHKDKTMDPNNKKKAAVC